MVEDTRSGAAPIGGRVTLVQRLWLHRWFVLVTLIVTGLAGWQGLRILLGPAVVVEQVKRGNLVQSVVASGHYETPYRVEIGSQITGIVVDVPVEEGEQVEAGQVLVTLEASELRAAVVQATGSLEQAKAHMRQISEMTLPAAQESLKGAQATLQEVEKTSERTSTLSAKGYASSASLDGVQKDLELARAQVRTAQLQIYNASPGGSDYVFAQTQIAQAYANLDTARSRLSYASINAPRSGVVIRRMAERGMVAQPGRTLLVLAPTGQTQLVIQLDERNLGLLHLGQTAIASAEAYSDRNFAAKVSFINPAVDIARASVEVKLDVVDPPAYLRQDMTVSVDIEVARREQALIVPLRGVHDAMSGRPWILGIRNGRAVRQPVKIGVRSGSFGEIVEGAAEGDAVIPVGAGVMTGQRIRAVLP